MKAPEDSYTTLHKLLTRELGTTAAPAAMPPAAGPFPPCLSELPRSSGSPVGPSAPELSAALGAERVDAAGDAVHTAPLRPDPQLSRQLISADAVRASRWAEAKENSIYAPKIHLPTSQASSITNFLLVPLRSRL